MPKLADDDLEADTLEAVTAAVEEFAAEFKRSSRGNLWRRWQGLALTVFRRRNRYAWCMSGIDTKRFSSHSFESEDDAILGLASELFVGQ
jgi:hypothetical protein